MLWGILIFILSYIYLFFRTIYLSAVITEKENTISELGCEVISLRRKLRGAKWIKNYVK